MKVFRFEKENKDGPYRPTKGYTSALGFITGLEDIPVLDYYKASGDEESSPADLKVRPMPTDDFSPFVLAAHRPDEVQFGFATKTQARHWFPNEAGRKAMAKHGIRLDEFEVPARYVHKGRHQLMFEKGHETFIAAHDAVKLD